MSDTGNIPTRILQLMDLTTLNQDDQEQQIITLCQQAATPIGNCAAICILPTHIQLARQLLKQQNIPSIGVATVTNFPAGTYALAQVLAETERAIDDGAQEIDMVFPWRDLLAGNTRTGSSLVSACKQRCTQANVLLKVIIESGELKQAASIKLASEVAIDAGADFIKTSTGKVAINATLAAAQIMLRAISDKGVQRTVGFKAAGGIRTLEEAIAYVQLAEGMMGVQWVTARHFRIGASALRDDLLQKAGVTNAGGSIRH